LGLSLGINLMPTGYKLCPFNCVYCQYGWSSLTSLDFSSHAADLPSPADVEKALVDVLRDGMTAEHITFSGNGESSVHPEFAEIVDRVIRARDRYLPSARTCILSNAAGVLRADSRAAMARLEVTVLKLDAGDEETFREINRPCDGISLRDLLEGMRCPGRFRTQTLFVDGEIENVSDTKRKSWIDRLAELQPERAQIYSLDRAPAHSGLLPVDYARLEEIAAEAEARTGVPVVAFGR
jgi:wyosine [tRNA(Phe)-imidazoG37] synthetase (radical SAM superfamily)